MNQKQRSPGGAAGGSGEGSPLRLRSSDLFRCSNRVEIEHRGETYRLQITRQGRLILTK
jgi:hemin uptake protein HemP